MITDIKFIQLSEIDLSNFPEFEKQYIEYIANKVYQDGLNDDYPILLWWDERIQKYEVIEGFALVLAMCLLAEVGDIPAIPAIIKKM